MKSSIENSNNEQKPSQLNQDTLTQQDIPNYLKRLKSKLLNDKVGQTFITSSKRPQQEVENSESPSLEEKIIQDIMRVYKVDRKTAIQIFNKPL